MASKLTPGQVQRRIDSRLNGTPLSGTGKYFVKSGAENNVNPFLLLAIAKAESSLAMDPRANAVATKNPFGLGPHYTYPSWEASIAKAAEVIKGYNVQSVEGIQRRWAPIGAANDPRNVNSNWTRNVLATMRQYGYGNTDIHYTDVGETDLSQSIPGAAADGAGEVAEQASEFPGISQLLEILKFITNPALWMRIAAAIAGFIALIAGGYFAIKGGNAGRPLGIVVMSAGFLFVIAGVRGINPADLVKGLLGV